MRIRLGVGLLFIALQACSSANFKGQSATQTVPPAASLSCADPQAVLVGETTKIIVTANNTSGPLYQQIRNASGATVDDQQLVKTDAGWAIKLDDTKVQENSFAPKERGTFTIHLSETAGQFGEASCRVAIEEQVIPPNPKCTDGKRVIGSDTLLAFDISGSNGTYDCPDSVELPIRDQGAKVYVCRQQTYKEKAALASLDQLVALANSAKPESISQLSVLSFPNDSIHGGSSVIQPWMPVLRIAKPSLESLLMVARRPRGNTPFSAAFEGAMGLFRGVSPASPTTAPAGDGVRPKLMIFLTDGLPTDTNLAQVEQQAKELKDMGVFIQAVFLGDESRKADMIARHRETMEGNEALWRNQYPSLDEYMKAAVGTNIVDGLLGRVSSAAPIPVASPEQLSATFTRVIKEQAQRCQ